MKTELGEEFMIGQTTKLYVDFDSKVLHIESSIPQLDMNTAKVIADKLGEVIPIVFNPLYSRNPLLAGRFTTGSGWTWTDHSNRYLEQSMIQMVTS